MEGVSRSYNHRTSSVTALRDANVKMNRGGYVSIVGPSGSGKSALLLMLGGMLSPTGERVYVDGSSLYDMTPNERAAFRKKDIGFAFQTFNLVPYLNALENVRILLFLAGKREAAQQDHATRWLERVGLGDRMDHEPSELSVGQQQRVALARVLANDPTVILADEPTGNLDPETGRQVIDFFDGFNEEGRTTVVVTHDPRAAERAKTTLRLVEDTVLNGQVESSRGAHV